MTLCLNLHILSESKHSVLPYAFYLNLLASPDSTCTVWICRCFPVGGDDFDKELSYMLAEDYCDVSTSFFQWLLCADTGLLRCECICACPHHTYHLAEDKDTQCECVFACSHHGYVLPEECCNVCTDSFVLSMSWGSVHHLYFGACTPKTTGVVPCRTWHDGVQSKWCDHLLSHFAANVVKEFFSVLDYLCLCEST